MNSHLVSVIIPVYNAELFIVETINAVLNQDYKNIEIIVVNDGSTDNSEKLIKGFSNPKIRYFLNENHGVSFSRNFGLSHAKGEYVMFLDSDDLLTPIFISERVKVLDKFDFFGFVCGVVRKISDKGEILNTDYKSSCNDISLEILTFDKNIVTCPSSYLFRKKSLIENKLLFNENLSSSADRYYLLEIDKYIKGYFIRNTNACLYYRFRTDSMSNKLDIKLIKDNEVFYDLVLNRLYPDPIMRRKFLSKSKYVLSGAYFKIGNYFLSIRYAVLAFLYAPLNFFRTLFKVNVDEF